MIYFGISWLKIFVVKGVMAARDINNRVSWHDFHACSIKKNDDIR